MSYGKEKAVHRNIKYPAILSLYPHPVHSVHVPEHLPGVAVPEYLDIRGVQDPLLHCAGCPEDIPADYHVDLVAYPCKVRCLLAGSVPSSDDSHILLPVEETVTGRAGGHAHPLELLLRWQAEIPCSRPCRYHKAVGEKLRLPVHNNPERPGRQVGSSHRPPPDIRAETHGLRPHRIHKPLPGYSVLETRIVLYVGSGGQLASRL